MSLLFNSDMHVLSIMRAFRALRPLKVLSKFKGIKVIVSQKLF
jgi:hypothetical protein